MQRILRGNLDIVKMPATLDHHWGQSVCRVGCQGRFTRESRAWQPSKRASEQEKGIDFAIPRRQRMVQQQSAACSESKWANSLVAGVVPCYELSSPPLRLRLACKFG